MKNTKIEYLYRDPGNYKTHNEAVVAGTLTKEQIEDIISCLDEQEFFLPAQVGLPEERSDDYDPNYDHPWFELCANDFSETDLPTTVTITADELVKRFASMRGKWDTCIDLNGVEIMPDN